MIPSCSAFRWPSPTRVSKYIADLARPEQANPPRGGPRTVLLDSAARKGQEAERMARVEPLSLDRLPAVNLFAAGRWRAARLPWTCVGRLDQPMVLGLAGAG